MAKEQDIRQALDFLSGRAPAAASRGDLALRSISVPMDDHPWLKAQGISAMGMAERITGGIKQQDLALKVYVEKKLPLEACDYRIPAEIQMHGLPPIPMDVEEIGRIVPHSNVARIRPASPGYSTGLEGNVPTTATFGLVVRKRLTSAGGGQRYVLSNSHAIANSGLASQGDVITQPGAADGGGASDGIAKLSEWVPFIFTEEGYPNVVDAAIAALDAGVSTPEIPGIGIPGGVNASVTRGMHVQKVGRTTTFSIAFIKDVDVRLPATYPRPGNQVGRVGFSDQVMTSFYSAPGDSGSAVLDMNGRVVGLHFAGSPQVGVFNKINNVLDALALDVVTAADFEGA